MLQIRGGLNVRAGAAVCHYTAIDEEFSRDLQTGVRFLLNPKYLCMSTLNYAAEITRGALTALFASRGPHSDRLARALDCIHPVIALRLSGPPARIKSDLATFYDLVATRGDGNMAVGARKLHWSKHRAIAGCLIDLFASLIRESAHGRK